MNKLDRGMGALQLGKASRARISILKVLSDGEWHQYKEIGQKAKLSNPTLSKHLKEFKKGIEKKEDDDDSRIIYYRIKNTLLSGAQALSEAFVDAKLQKKVLEMTKDPYLAMERINNHNNFGLFLMLKFLKDERNQNESEKALKTTTLFLLESWILAPYRILTESLLDESGKILNEIDLEKLENRIENRNVELLRMLKSEGVSDGIP